MTTSEWDSFRKHTKPLKASRRISPPPPATTPKRKTNTELLPPPMPAFSGAPLQPSQRGLVDGGTQTRLKKGKLPIEAVLDLHGYRLEAAQQALESFVAQAYGAGKRCLLVITGKGRSDGPSIRSLLPEWMNVPAIRPYLLTLEQAAQKDGGSGAFYLLLKSQRKTQR